MVFLVQRRKNQKSHRRQVRLNLPATLVLGLTRHSAPASSGIFGAAKDTSADKKDAPAGDNVLISSVNHVAN